LLDGIGRVVDPSGFRGQPGASIGIALSGPNCRTTDELLRRADIAMYSVKASGRAGVATFDATMSHSRTGRAGLAEALDAALTNDELRVHYQPIVDLQTRQISGVEALVRWLDPERGLLLPDSFIDAAEETGMIIPVGRRILEIACGQMAAWRRDLPGAEDLHLSVNLSVRQLEHDQIQADVQDTLRLTELDPTALTLEVTESIFVNNATSARTRLHALKALGIGLAIDDFGTGFSSLGYIHNYPFDILKIDRTFVKGIGSTSNSGAIVRTMLALAKQLSMAVVAEGIESRAELAQLRALRCGYGQGYLFSKPMSAADLEQLLTTGGRELDVSRL
jgi:EAL domain-containing protein (putative c-di-GMP-specific phosphodiesterase class I)